MSGAEDIGVLSIEGPARYSARDIARVFSQALGRPVEPVATPRSGFIATFRAQGFSSPAADAYARITETTLDQPLVPLSETEKGETTRRRMWRGWRKKDLLRSLSSSDIKPTASRHPQDNSVRLFVVQHNA